MKLYVDEEGATEARGWPSPIATSALSVAEVVAAFWAKVQRGELAAELAAILDRAFLADVHDGRMVIAGIDDTCTARSLDVVRRHQLRGADALQLGTALALRGADASLQQFAAYDARLRAAAAAEGFTLLPSPWPLSAPRSPPPDASHRAAGRAGGRAA